MIVAFVLFEVTVVAPNVAVAEAVFVTEPAETSVRVVVYIPVQVVDAPGANGLVALAQLMVTAGSLSSMIS